MCSNFGMNLHPDKKPCALQWEWHAFFTRLRFSWRKLICEVGLGRRGW
jgi:hypothetical protein